MSIQVQQLTKKYGSQIAVNELSFETQTAEIVGFLGPNGAGKSTTMKMLTCYLPPTEGTAMVCGYDIVKNPLEVRQHIGYLPEHNPLYVDMYVQEYLLFAARLHKITQPQQRVAAMIALTGLQNEQHKKITALSKGYRQRVGIAQAMIHNPQVLILDEPTAGLDPNQLAEIRQVIKTLGSEKTVLLSTHIMQEVQTLCDRILIINKGNLIANDTAQQLQQKTQHAFVITIELAQKIEPKRFKTIQHLENVQDLGNGQYQITANKDIRADLFQFAVQNQLTLLGMSQEKNNLEEVFRQLTAAGRS